jgi:hypothetical protein
MEPREIDLHRQVCVVKMDTIDIRPARSAAIVPLIGFLLGVLALIAVIVWLERLPFVVVLLLTVGAILLVPFSAMGFVYSIYGANVVIDGRRQTAVWQQGLLGMGVGTRELVPFSKIERLEVEEVSGDGGPGPDDFAQFEVRLLRTGGRTLPLGQTTVPRDLASEGLARARAVGEAAAVLVGKPFVVIGEEQRPRRLRGRRARRRMTTVV